MSQEMGVPRDGLISQAVFMLGRLNGYVIPGKTSATADLRTPAPATAARPESRRPTGMMPKPGLAAGPPRKPPPDPHDDEPLPDGADEGLPQDEDGNPFEDSNLAASPSGEEEQPPQEEEEPEVSPPPRKGGATGTMLTLIMVGRDPYRVPGDSMVLGRGKHCDFVIESNRVSREHARLTRDGADWLLEDLNSSNGTFYGTSKEKVSRRKIKDGDEFTFGTEKVKMSVRAR
jgi:hypothetical protein